MAKRLPTAVRKYMAELGRKGGKVSGKMLTPEQREQRARNAAMARWKKPS